VIDAPQGAAPLIVEQARKWNTPIACLVNTHGHWDHILDNAELLRLTGAKFGIHRESAPLLIFHKRGISVWIWTLNRAIRIFSWKRQTIGRR
jgi:glyoxylase-like metal-dependent hydrolase (beta-lactamase superfamily II)